MPRLPLVDLTTINGVESLFRDGPRDPYARQLAARLADLVVYSETVRYAMPVQADDPITNEPEIPTLLSALIGRDSQAFKAERFPTVEPIQLKREYLADCFDQFDSWARANRFTLGRLLAVHSQPWLRRGHEARIQHGLIFDIDHIFADPRTAQLGSVLETSPEMVAYTLDVILRYPLYGDLAGPDQPYFNHPVRDVVRIPTDERTKANLWQPAVSFAREIEHMAASLSLDEYCVLLHELRARVRESGLHRVGPGEVDREVVREIANKVRLPPRLKGLGKGLAVAGGVLAGVGAIAAAAPAAAVAGAVVAVSAAVWDGQLPRGASQARWLKWAFEWAAEEQAEPRK